MSSRAGTGQLLQAAPASMLGLAAASWVVAVRQMNAMGMGVTTRLGSFAFFVSLWVAVVGFIVMLLSGLVIYHYLKRMGKDQIQSWKLAGRFSVTGMLARLAERFRGPQSKSS